MNASTKNCHLTVVDGCKVDGEHKAVGEVLLDVDVELARDLVGAGRARLATDDEVAAVTGETKTKKK